MTETMRKRMRGSKNEMDIFKKEYERDDEGEGKREKQVNTSHPIEMN